MYLEKMVSGMYLGEILRLVARDLAHRGILFPEAEKNNPFSRRGSVKTEDMSLIEADVSSNFGEIENYLAVNGIKNVSMNDKLILKHLCKIISERSARIAASAISAVVTWIDPELKNNHTIGIDGSLYEKYPGYKDMLIKFFSDLFNEKAKKIKLELAKDGSGVGSAIIAAVAASSEKIKT
jgi:hexokinase